MSLSLRKNDKELGLYIFGKVQVSEVDDTTDLEHTTEAVDIFLSICDMLRFGKIKYIYINSTGGDVEAENSILSAIAMSDNKPHCVIAGLCYSAATSIALSCNHIVVSPVAELMFHPTTSSYDRNNLYEITAMARTGIATHEYIVRNIYSRYLTNIQLKTLLHGGVVSMTGEEFYLQNQRMRGKCNFITAVELLDF